MEEAITDVRALNVGSKSLCADRTNQRDMAVVFHGHRHCVAVRDDAIPRETYEALAECIGNDHEVLFFDVMVLSEPSLPERSYVPAPPRDAIEEEKDHLDHAFEKAGLRPILHGVPFPLLICDLKLAEGFTG